MNPFQLSFLDEQYLYIVVGYGEQESGGFSIEVEGLKEDGNKIYIETNLIGPSADKIVKKKATTPYIVIKTEAIDKEIIYL